MRRWWQSAVALILAPAAVLLVTAGPAAADPGGIGEPDSGGGMTIDSGRWPAALNKYIVGSDEYEKTYGTENPDPIAGQCNSAGGDLWAYTLGFFIDLGSILDAASTATGKPWLGVLDDDKHAVATTPWDAAGFGASNYTVKVGSDGGADVYASPGLILNFDHSASPFGPCLNDFAQYAAPDAASAFGFDFYPSPDDASVAFMVDAVGSQNQSLVTASGETQAPASQYWDPVAGGDNPLRTWDYSPLDVGNYCTDAGNPFCATATFLHCPAVLPADPVAAQAVINCRIFNANVMLLNQKLALWLMVHGSPAGKGVNPLAAITDPGKQAPLDQWFAVATSGKQVANAAKMVLGVLAGGLIAGGLLAGGLTGALIAAGVIALAASGALDAVWGAVECGTDFFKCLAKGGVDSLNTSMGLVMRAAATPQRADLTSFSPLFNKLAGISGVIVVLLFLLTLAVAGVTAQVGRILPAGIGLVQWAVTIGLGTTVIAALGALSDRIADVIGGSSSTNAITTLAKSMSQAGTDLPKSVTGGWLLAFVVAVIATIAGAIIWLVLTAAPSFIPLAVALMILQASGLGSGGFGRKWLARGFGVLWAIVLLRPTISLVAQVAGHVSLTDGIGGLIAGSLMLAVAAIAPWWIGKQFPLAREEGFGMGAAALGGMAMAGRFRPHRVGGAAGRASRGRTSLARTAAGPGPTAGPGGLGGGPMPVIPPRPGGPSGSGGPNSPLPGSGRAPDSPSAGGSTPAPADSSTVAAGPDGSTGGSTPAGPDAPGPMGGPAGGLGARLGDPGAAQTGRPEPTASARAATPAAQPSARPSPGGQAGVRDAKLSSAPPIRPAEGQPSGPTGGHFSTSPPPAVSAEQPVPGPAGRAISHQEQRPARPEPWAPAGPGDGLGETVARPGAASRTADGSGATAQMATPDEGGRRGNG